MIYNPANILFILLIICSYSEIKSQSAQIKNFFNDLIKSGKDLSIYLHPDELKKSNRLGINYEGINNKFLISYDIDDEIKQKINAGELSYNIVSESLEDDFLKITFKINGSGYKKDFFFKDEKLVSHSSYHTGNWEEKESEYFRIFLSDPVLCNDYSVSKLDNFVEVMLDLLNIPENDKTLLKKEKINYILCSDETEIEKVSGFNTRGIYILAYDEIITTYNCHFHEIAHLLINFRLKSYKGRLPLYTLPFFQEGFATAVGGRGGLSSNVLIDIGKFLHKSKFIPFNSIITKEEFLSEDASLTYPVAALYNLFLLEEFGIENYLKLYTDYSGNIEFVANLSLNSILLPPVERFMKYLENYTPKSGIVLNSDENFTKISERRTAAIEESENYYLIKIHSNLLLRTTSPLLNYKSKKFNEVFPGVKYAGYNYLIKADSREVNIYNLYTNILIASYSAGFTLDNNEVPNEDGYFIFYVKKNIFEEEIKELLISEI